MASCEKCWRDARGDPDEYAMLIEQRNNTGQTCTPEQQAGDEATMCPFCLRKTVHMFSDVCMVPTCESTTRISRIRDALSAAAIRSTGGQCSGLDK